MTDIFLLIVAVIGLIFFIAIVFLPIFVWEARNASIRAADTLARIERALASHAKNADAVARNIDANLADAATTLGEIRRGDA